MPATSTRAGHPAPMDRRTSCTPPLLPRRTIDRVHHDGDVRTHPVARLPIREPGLFHHAPGACVRSGGDADDPLEAVRFETEVERRQRALGRETATPPGLVQL